MYIKHKLKVSLTLKLNRYMKKENQSTDFS